MLVASFAALVSQQSSDLRREWRRASARSASVASVIAVRRVELRLLPAWWSSVHANPATKEPLRPPYNTHYGTTVSNLGTGACRLMALAAPVCVRMTK